MIIDCIADLHGHFPKLKGGDLLIIAGDLTASDDPLQFIRFLNWLDKQKYKKKIFIAGNHDMTLEKNGCPTNTLPPNTEYLCDSGTEYEGLKIWGSPWTPTFTGVNPRCTAFMKHDDALFDEWQKIPMKTDILITHGPAYSILDGVPTEYDGTLYHTGSHSLYGYLNYVERPQYHIFGHIHEAHGQEEYFCAYNNKMMRSINCSFVNGKYAPVNRAIRIVHG